MMNIQNRKPRLFYIAIDLIFLFISFGVSYLYYYNQGVFLHFIEANLREEIIMPFLDYYLMIFSFQMVITVMIFAYHRLYHTSREWSYIEEILIVIKALLWSILPVSGAIFFLKAKVFSRWIFLNSFFLNVLFLSFWRCIKRYLIRRHVLKGFRNLQVLIVGTGKTANYLYHEIQQYPYLGLTVAGFLSKGNDDSENLPKKILGSVEDFEKIVQKYYIDEVFVTTPHQSEEFAELVSCSEKMGVSLKVVPDHIDFQLSEIKVHSIGVIPMFEYRTRSIHGSEIIFKRIFDIIVSFCLLVLLLPFILFIALLIKIDSKGPVFYISKRCGYKGKKFSFIKFRTMIKKAETLKKELIDRNEKDGPIFKMKDDPRVTRVGKILRKYSLDEIPQLWNVMIGDMSLVGPRPPLPEEVSQYKVWQLKRLNIRPGITCLWQISGRSDLTFDEWMKMDIFYIENWSFLLDLKILLLTVNAVFKGRGAY